MESASVQPAVLDYAPPPLADAVVRRMRALMVILICIVGGGFGGWLFEPRDFLATGYLHVATDPTAAAIAPLNLSTVETRQAEVAARMSAPENLKAVVAVAANPRMAPIPVTVTEADLNSRLRVRAVPQSRLIAVSYIDPDGRTANAVVNAVMVREGFASGAQIVGVPAAQRQRNLLVPLAGAVIGLLAGRFIVARRSK